MILKPKFNLFGNCVNLIIYLKILGIVFARKDRFMGNYTMFIYSWARDLLVVI